MKETSTPRFQPERHGCRLRAMRRNPAGGKNTPSRCANAALRRIRLIRVKDERGCRVMAAGSNLGGTAGYAYTRSRPEQNESVRGGFFWKKANRTAKGLPMRAKGRLMTMQAMTGKTEGRHSTLDEVLAMETGAGDGARLVHTLRDLGDVRFALLRMPQGVLQCVLGAGEDVRDGDAVTVSGEAVRDERAPGGVGCTRSASRCSPARRRPCPCRSAKQDEPVARYGLVAALL